MSQFLLSAVDPFISPNDKSQHSVKQGEFVSFQDEIYDIVYCVHVLRHVKVLLQNHNHARSMHMKMQEDKFFVL